MDPYAAAMLEATASRLEVAVLCTSYAHLHQGDASGEIPADFFPSPEAAALAATLTPAELAAGFREYVDRIAAQPNVSAEAVEALRRALRLYEGEGE
jgi:hypothetical protein